MLAVCNTFYAFRDTRKKTTNNCQPQAQATLSDGQGGCETMTSSDSEGCKLPSHEICFYQGQISTSMEGRRYGVLER